MANTLKLEIVTPESKIYSEDIEMVTLPGSEGEAGIYPNHVPLMTKVQAGEIVVSRDGNEEILAIGEGFAEITGQHVAILTDYAANSGDIDEAAAEQAKTKAEQHTESARSLYCCGPCLVSRVISYHQSSVDQCIIEVIMMCLEFCNGNRVSRSLLWLNTSW